MDIVNISLSFQLISKGLLVNLPDTGLQKSMVYGSENHLSEQEAGLFRKSLKSTPDLNPSNGMLLDLLLTAV